MFILLYKLPKSGKNWELRNFVFDIIEIYEKKILYWIYNVEKINSCQYQIFKQ